MPREKSKAEDESIPEPAPEFEEPESEEESEKESENNPEEISPSEDLAEEPQSVGEPKPPIEPAPIPPHEERTWAMLSHLSVLLNLVTGFLGGVAAIIIYFIYKDRSRYVAYHAMQSFLFQTITWLGAGLLGGLLIGLGTTLGFLIIPLLCLFPGFLVLLAAPASLIYGIIGAVKVNNGEDFRYWEVGDWVRDILEPKPVPKI